VPVCCWRIAINEPCIFRPDWRRTVTGEDARFCFCKQTLWAALEKFPEARQALDDFLVEAFRDEEEGNCDNAEECHQSE
jgi:hypothetical protein